LAVVLQAALLTKDYLLPWGRNVWALHARPPWERSARLAVWLEPPEVEFLQFLRQQTPADAELVFFGTSGLYSWKEPLQYLLFPRRISVCDPSADTSCLAIAIRTGRYLVDVDGRPGPQAVPPTWRHTPFGGGRGFYHP
jgi:hypothetical protein